MSKYEFFRYHGFWAFGVRLFRQLPFRGKASLIALVFMAPLVVLSALFVQVRMESIQSARLERQGVAYVSRTIELLHQAQKYRDQVLHGLGAGGSSAATDDARQALEAQFAQIESVDKSMGSALGTTEALAKAHEAMKATLSSGGMGPVYVSHAKLSESIYKLIAAAADGGSLTLDPDFDTYYLMDACVLHLPRLADQISRMQSLAAVTALTGQGGDIAALELNRLDTLIEDLSDAAASSTSKVAGVHAEAAEGLNTAAMSALLSQLRDQATDSPGSGGAPKAAQLDQIGGQVTTAVWTLQSHEMEMLDALLAARIDHAWRSICWMGALALFCLLLAAYFFYSFYLVIDGGMRLLRRHMESVAEGDLTGVLQPWGRDDAAQLMLALSDMQRALRAIVGEVRGSAQHIASASDQIAQGAVDMSQRTEQAAANLQRSSNAMEDVTSGVAQAAELAREAASLANDNADVAGAGGQIIGNMVTTMDEINASSRRIADILAVIDGIAFQTNILALNAAVEAARAGEQGRGFAVVASEVRNLAQRAATSAREIRQLITESVEKVEAGSSVVQHAGKTMTQIVGNAEKIRHLLNVVHKGAEGQSISLGQIGSSVSDLDVSTQHNASLSEQTAAAATVLSQHAAVLVGQVSRFKLPA